MPKTPKTAQPFPPAGKHPRTAEAPSSDEQMPVWQFRRLDFDGPWCPKALTGANLVAVIKKLAGFEGQNWTQIQGSGRSHFVSVDKLIPEARKRLTELKLDDTDKIFSLSLSGKERLWGLRFRNTLLMLWWDPDHQICPSHLKHT